MLPITSPLLFHIQPFLNIFGNIIVSLKRGTLLDVPDESSICIAFCRLGRASSVGLIDMVGLVRLHLRSAIARIHPLSIRQLEICHDTGSSQLFFESQTKSGRMLRDGREEIWQIAVSDLAAFGTLIISTGSPRLTSLESVSQQAFIPK